MAKSVPTSVPASNHMVKYQFMPYQTMAYYNHRDEEGKGRNGRRGREESKKERVGERGSERRGETRLVNLPSPTAVNLGRMGS